MSDFTEDFNGMLKRLFLGCDAFTVEIAAVTGFKAPYEALRVISGDIDDLTTKQRERITGRTIAKHVDKNSLSTLAGDIATITSGYAHAIGDQELVKQMDWTPSAILKLRDEEIAKDCRNIYDAAFAHKTELLNYGITLLNFTDLDTMINDWETNSQLNLVAWKQKRIYTAQILAKVVEGKSIVENILDKVIVGFKTSSPNLVQIYNTIRFSMPHHSYRRVNTGNIIGFVYIKDEDIPITAYVSTTVNGVLKRVESDMDGEYKNILPIGTYTFTCEKVGFVTKTAENIEIKHDNDVLLNFEMEKVVPV